MAVVKAQLVVWVLIAGISAGGVMLLSRVKTPEPVARALAAQPVPAAVVAPQPVAVASLPATIPEFPFPEDLVTATVGAEPQSAIGQSFAEVAGEAIPEMATLGAPSVATLDGISVPDAAPPVPEAVADAAEEPPIPMPARPLMAQPVKAVPLSEVKTLYVVADALNVRAAPSTSGPVLQKLPQGFAVAAREQAAEWIGFVMRDGSTGWMRNDYLSDTMPTPLPAPAAASLQEPLNLMM